MLIVVFIGSFSRFSSLDLWLFDHFHAGRFFVLVKVRFQGKSFVASRTDKRLCIGVGLDVSSKVGLVGKGLVANMTTKRFFTYENSRFLITYLVFSCIEK